MYVDGQAQVTWFDSDLSSRQLGDDLASGNKGFGYAFGVEAGKRIALNPDWTVTPQGQLYYASVAFDDFTDPSGARHQLDEGASMPARLGVSLDQERAWKSPQPQWQVADAFRRPRQPLLRLPRSDRGKRRRHVADRQQCRRSGGLTVGGTYIAGTYGAYAVYGEGLISTSLASFGDNYTNAATFGLRMLW